MDATRQLNHCRTSACDRIRKLGWTTDRCSGGRSDPLNFIDVPRRKTFLTPFDYGAEVSRDTRLQNSSFNPMPYFYLLL